MKGKVYILGKMRLVRKAKQQAYRHPYFAVTR